MLEVLRRPSDGSPLADRRWTSALRRPPDRLARPRPRLGDGGPQRARVTPGRPPGAIQPDAAAAAAMHVRRRLDRPRAARGRRCRPTTSRACARPAAGSADGGGIRGGAARPRSRPSRIWAGVASSRSRPRTTRSIPWRRSSTTTRSRRSSCRADRGSAGRPTWPRRRRTARRCRPSRPPCPPPSATRRTGPGEPADRARARTARTGPRHVRVLRPRVERRPRAVAAVDEALRPEAPPARRDTARRPRTGAPARDPPGTRATSRSSRSAASYSGRQRWRSWSSIRSSTRPPVARAMPQTQMAFATWPRCR